MPTTASGLPLTSVSDVRLVFPVPADSTLVSASLSGGEGFGDAVPVLTLNLTAGTEGTTITTA